MRDRIVPIERTDLMNIYYLFLVATEDSVTVLHATNVGEFAIAAAGFCDEPLKNATVTAASGVVFFVPAFDYEGFVIGGEKVETEGVEVVADGCTLYSATIADGGITIAKVSL